MPGTRKMNLIDKLYELLTGRKRFVVPKDADPDPEVFAIDSKGNVYSNRDSETLRGLKERHTPRE